MPRGSSAISNDESKSSAEQSKKGKPVKLTLDIVYAGDKVGPGYFTFKDGELSSKSPYKGHKMPSKIVFAIKESGETKKERLDEGMVMISSLLPVGGLIGMPPKRVDNFEFKGLPGQFNENGDKVLDEMGQPINEYADRKTVEKNIKSYVKSIKDEDERHQAVADLKKFLNGLL